MAKLLQVHTVHNAGLPFQRKPALASNVVVLLQIALLVLAIASTSAARAARTTCLSEDRNVGKRDMAEFLNDQVDLDMASSITDASSVHDGKRVRGQTSSRRSDRSY